MDQVEYLAPDVVNGLNLYAYCGNNPVMNVDPNGHFIIALILSGCAAAGAVIGGIVAYKNASKEGKAGTELFWSTIGGVFLGGAVGLAVGGAVVMLGAVGAGALGYSTVFGGVAIAKAFSIGALAYNFFAFVVAPLMGIAMDGIEFSPSPTVVPKPGRTVPHPAEK